MTDELEPTPEQRLPATRPPERLSAERFTAAPSVKSIDGLTPERGASIVRQSSNARWIGFLTVCFVALFTIGYWFYELGAPLGISEARLLEEVDKQQVTAVERGYNVYQANCARCHGPTGLGLEDPNAAAAEYIGPRLNSDEKLFAHLNEAYLRNILEVGGRYACGNANSAMPVWSDQGTPPGPLNYRQIEELIAFLRAPKDHTYIVKDPSLNEPVIDPETGEERTFTGWRDPNYKPAPDATPYPACWLDAIGGGGGASPGPGASIDPDAPVLTVTAPSGAASSGWDPDTLEAKAGEGFTLDFKNDDPTTGPHNIVIKDGDTAIDMGGDTKFFTGPGERKYAIAGLDAGEYSFVCEVHPTTMTGTLTVE